MFPTYEAMAESLEQFKFPEYPDELFIQLADNITQAKDETAVEISSNELAFRKLTYMSMLDTKILPFCLQEICSNGFKLLLLYDFGLDTILQVETLIYINSNLEYFKVVFENIRDDYFSENPDLKPEDKRTNKAIIGRFINQNINNGLSNRIVDFISRRNNLRDKLFYERNSKQSVHKYWSEILSKQLIVFEGNYFIWNARSRFWTCSDFITMDRSFKQIPEFNSLYNHVRNDSQWQNALKTLGTEFKGAAPTISSPLYPLFALLTKFHLLDCINHKAAACISQDIIEDFKKDLRHLFKDIEIPKGLAFKNILYLQETKLRSPKKFPSYEMLIAALYQITEGRKSLLDNVAKLFAKIFLGRKLCNTMGIASPSVTVITTSNLKFLYDFLQSVFTLRLKQDPCRQRGTTFNERNKWYKTNPQNTGYYCSGLTGFEIKSNPNFLMKPENQLCHPNSAFSDFFVRKCHYNGYNMTPITEDEYDSRNLDKHDLNDYFHYTHYGLSELCSKKSIGKFIEDKLLGNLVNVAINQHKEIESNLDTKQFVSMCKGERISSSQDFFKLEKIYTSNTHYIFLQNDAEANDLFNEINPEVIELSHKIPSRAYLFEPLDDFLPHEKLFATVDLAVYGLNLLLQKESGPKQPPKLELLNLKDKDVLLAYFFTHCCNTVKIGDDEAPTSYNATCAKVLMKGFQAFCNIVSNGTISPSKIDKNVKDRFLPYVCIYQNETNPSKDQMRMSEIPGIKERLANNGYTVDNDGIPKDKTNWWVGIVEKSLDEIEKEANKLLIEQENLRSQRDSAKIIDEPLPPTDFIKLLAKIGKWNDLYNGLENS